ncbi:MAG: hypothetical protein M0Z46_08845 [Actinomycetota bacterium]|jgi:hypothetical protein|nr:hypothetical protein [Actinomycetota bacterium]
MADERNETKAAVIVAALAGVHCRRLDDGRNGSVADFELLDRNGKQAGLLEVTSDVDEDSARFAAAARSHEQRAPTGGGGREPKLHKTWKVYVGHPPPQLKRLRKDLLPLLRKLEKLYEAEWISLEVGAGSLFCPCVAEVCDGLRKRRVTYVDGVPTRGGEAGAILFDEAQPAGFASAAKVTEAANRQLAKEDNQRKLAGDGARRWLFVWASEPAGQAMRHGPAGPHSPGPALPDGITGVWVAPMFGPPPAGDVWFSDGSAWEAKWSPSRVLDA